MNTFQRVAGAILLIGILSTASATHSQDWPTRQVTIVSQLSAGGAADVLARAVATDLSSRLGQPVIVENRPGGGGTLASEYVARSRPDGSILLLSSAFISVTPLILKSPTIDPLTDFTALTMAVQNPVALAVHKSFPASDVREFVAYARANPGKLSFSSTGIYSTHHLAGEYLNKLAKLDLAHVAYRGGNPAMADLVAGQPPISFVTLSNALPHLESGAIKILGVVEATQSLRRPEIPRIGDAVPGYEVPSSWLGFLAPANVSAPLAGKIHAELVKSIEAPGIRQMLENGGFEIMTSKSPADAQAFLRASHEQYKRILTEIGIQPQ